MPEFHVLKCISCRAFQVQQAKKSNKWACVRCGTKQSLQKVYAISTSAKDCRLVCSNLNMAVGEAEEEQAAMLAMGYMAGAHAEDSFPNQPSGQQQQLDLQHGNQTHLGSKPAPSWDEFVEGEDDEPAPGDWEQGQDGCVTELDGMLRHKGQHGRRKGAAGQGAAAGYQRPAKQARMAQDAHGPRQRPQHNPQQVHQQHQQRAQHLPGPGSAAATHATGRAPGLSQQVRSDVASVMHASNFCASDQGSWKRQEVVSDARQQGGSRDQQAAGAQPHRRGVAPGFAQQQQRHQLPSQCPTQNLTHCLPRQQNQQYTPEAPPLVNPASQQAGSGRSHYPHPASQRMPQQEQGKSKVLQAPQQGCGSAWHSDVQPRRSDQGCAPSSGAGRGLAGQAVAVALKPASAKWGDFVEEEQEEPEDAGGGMYIT